MELETAKPIERSATVRDSSNGPRVVLFVIGGISWSEIRACHRISKELNREIVIGSTRILTPSTTMDMLAELHHSSPSRRPRNPFSSRSQAPQSPSNGASAINPRTHSQPRSQEPLAREGSSIPQRQHSSRESPPSRDRIPSRSHNTRDWSDEVFNGPRTVVGTERNQSIPLYARRELEPSPTTRGASLAGPGAYASRSESRVASSDPQLDHPTAQKEKNRWFSKRK
jgi:hypothetical protein